MRLKSPKLFATEKKSPDRKGVNSVNSVSHWPIITDSRHYPKLPFQHPRQVVANYGKNLLYDFSYGR